MTERDDWHDELKRIGRSDAGDWLAKDISNSYTPGTVFMINGEPFDPNEPDPFAEPDGGATGDDGVNG